MASITFSPDIIIMPTNLVLIQFAMIAAIITTYTREMSIVVIPVTITIIIIPVTVTIIIIIITTTNNVKIRLN